MARGGQRRRGEERRGEATKQFMVCAGKEGERGDGRAEVGSGWRWGVADGGGCGGEDEVATGVDGGRAEGGDGGQGLGTSAVLPGRLE